MFTNALREGPKFWHMLHCIYLTFVRTKHTTLTSFFFYGRSPLSREESNMLMTTTYIVGMQDIIAKRRRTRENERPTNPETQKKKKSRV